jgi:3-keto-disaccharide hydrolase
MKTITLLHKTHVLIAVVAFVLISGILAACTAPDPNTNGSGSVTSRTTPVSGKTNQSGQQGSTVPVTHSGNGGSVSNSYAPGMNRLVMNDPLTNPGTLWGTDSHCTYNQNGLTITPSGGVAYACSESQSFSDFTAAVKLTLVGQACGGIRFRVSLGSQGFNAYTFEVCPNGSYTLSIEQDSQESPSTYSVPNIRQSNEITVVAQGATLAFFINGQHVNTIIDPTFSDGVLGLLADTGFSTGQAVFTNVRIWE